MLLNPTILGNEGFNMQSSIILRNPIGRISFLHFQSFVSKVSMETMRNQHRLYLSLFYAANISIATVKVHSMSSLLKNEDVINNQQNTLTSAFTMATTPTTSTSSSLRPIEPSNSGRHRVVLMRHGESAFNNGNIFTGWCDVALTQRGIVEAVEAGEVFRSHNIVFRNCYVSLLTRSIITAHRTLEAAGCSYVPMKFDWRLNERHYGALQGLSKDRTADQLGTARVMVWRRSYTGRPPKMTPEHPHYLTINDDIRYQHVQDQIPLTESLQDCQHRVVLAWDDIVKQLQHQQRSKLGTNAKVPQGSVPSYLQSSPYTLIVAHANSLRALVMHLDNIPEEDIESLNIPTAIPFYYDIDVATGNVVHDQTLSTKNITENNSNSRGYFRGTYIADERKKRSFLERRRAANDPWLWALADDQVSRSMLEGTDDSRAAVAKRNDDFNPIAQDKMVDDIINEEAARNTQLFGVSKTNNSSLQ